MENNLVELGRSEVGQTGGSLTINVLPHIRKRDNIEKGDQVVYLQSPGSDDIIIRIKKKVT